MHAALIGYGYWGINVAKSLKNSTRFTLYTIFDSDLSRIKEAKDIYSFKEFDSLYELLLDDNIECVFIITPPHTHFDIAKKVIESKKHVFIEKPITTNVKDAEILYDMAYKNEVTIYCDHVFLHSPAVMYLKTDIKNFGHIACINARRINLGLFQSKIDVFWDLAIHDLSIIEYLLGLDIKYAKKFSKKYNGFPNDALANIYLELQDEILININISWLGPFKIREMIIAGSKKSVKYDDTLSNKLTFCDSGVFITSESKNNLYSQMVKYKIGNEFSPILSKKMPLDSSIEYFANKISLNLENDEIINVPIKYKNDKIANAIFLDDENHTISTLKAMELISKI